MMTRMVATLGLVLLSQVAWAQEAKTPDQSQIPPAVMSALQARFPAARIHKWTREAEGDVALYDIEFTQQGRKFEADIREDGVIDNWERAISAGDLPGAVTQAVEGKHPRSRLVEIMVITAVKSGKDQLEGYEIVLQTPDGKDVELTVAPDGRILEEAGVER